MLKILGKNNSFSDQGPDLKRQLVIAFGFFFGWH